MKNFLFVLLIIFYGPLLSQNKILSVSFSDEIVYESSGIKTYTEILSEGRIMEDSELENVYLLNSPEIIRKVFDIKNKTLLMYFDGVLVKTFIIQNYEVSSDGCYIFTHSENDLRNGNRLITKHIVNPTNNTITYTWYYDGDMDKSYAIHSNLLSLNK